MQRGEEGTSEAKEARGIGESTEDLRDKLFIFYRSCRCISDCVGSVVLVVAAVQY